MLLVRSRDSASYATTTYLVRIGPIRKLGRLDNHSCEEFTEGVEEVSFSLGFLDLVAVFGEGRFQAVIDGLRQVIVEGVEELLLRPCRDGWILDERIRHIVCGHAVQQELVVCLILGFVLVTFEVGANEVPESITYKCIKVLHTYDVSELFQQVGLAVAELHTRRDVLLNVLQFYFCRQS